MPDLRKLARGRECTIRIPAVCNGDPATVVLAHIRLPGVTGVAHKAPDLLGAWACSACHDEVDRRTRHHDAETVRLSFLEGMARTQYALLREGVIQW